MATRPNPEHSSRLARFVGWALVKNRQLRRDAQALRSALLSFPFAEKRRAGTSAGAAETTASAPRRRVSPTATPASTSARPLRVPTARPRAGEARDGDPDGARRASDEEPRETREQKEALFDCETYLRAIGVPARSFSALYISMLEFFGQRDENFGSGRPDRPTTAALSAAKNLEPGRRDAVLFPCRAATTLSVHKNVKLLKA